ncbi:MAG: hypothetical protein P9F19_15280 [Candidatus Contendobacter sp.]|nr:hypothetical protein [Candidatus Contendobacter sp.]MDG4558736.1 hypothetical protein [Candidatus Contendobacter sp.]
MSKAEENRAEKNLVFWRSLVGLDPEFPTLPPIPDRELSSLMVLDPGQIEELRASLGSHQLTQVVVEPGWGCTSLFRYMLGEARDRAMERLLLPISIDLERLFGKDPITLDGFEEEIKRQMIGLLVDNPWEQSLNRDYYFECIHFEYATDLPSYKSRMRAFLFDRPPAFRKLPIQFPWLKGSLPDLLNYLLRNFRIQTALYFHFPRDVLPQPLRDLVRSIKASHERGGVEFAALREVYFCTPLQKVEIERDFQRPFNALRYPRYTAAQIYAMLLKRYTPNVPGFRGRNQVGLDAVFAERFVQDAWRGAAALGEVAERVKTAMLQRLDCAEADVPFLLEPTPASSPPATAAPAVTPPRKKFERKSRMD